MVCLARRVRVGPGRPLRNSLAGLVRPNRCVQDVNGLLGEAGAGWSGQAASKLPRGPRKAESLRAGCERCAVRVATIPPTMPGSVKQSNRPARTNPPLHGTLVELKEPPKATQTPLLPRRGARRAGWLLLQKVGVLRNINEEMVLELGHPREGGELSHWFFQ